MARLLAFATLFALIIALATPGEASAIPAKKKGADGGEFEKLDTNKDGKLSKEEFAALKGPKAKPGKDAKTAKAHEMIFKKLDTNGDGFLSREEFAKLKDVLAGAAKKKAK